MIDSYSDFARFYDSLMEDARYPERAAYMLEVCKRYAHEPGLCLDLACGTGSLTRMLYQLGINVFGADGSADMLTVAASQAAEKGLNIPFICQDMRELSLAQPVDTCVCTLDSINHLTEPEDVQQTFLHLSENMNPGGLFVFDVNTPYKHREVLGNNAFTIENDTVFCAWQNVTEDGYLTEILLDFFEEQEDGSYRRYSEQFCERAYGDAQLRVMLSNAGFEVLGCFGDLTFEAPAQDEQRIIYIAKKELSDTNLH